ncbi:hypothetical protein FRC01_007848, partial [Tulasnella sp. 417]
MSDQTLFPASMLKVVPPSSTVGNSRLDRSKTAEAARYLHAASSLSTSVRLEQAGK